ncbi:DIP1984 family protein [Corynebacterium phoceense]|uniref:DIP1984 family protein n=1 Tax=Corynebacterium phoceense TaxID=1686286 RepID=UPI0034CD4898
MLLAEALAERAEAQARLDELRSRIVAVARVQEGDTPDEDPAELLAEAEHLVDRIDELVKAINATNSATAFDAERNLTAALADRDGLIRRRRLLADAAEAAARQDRFSRSEIKFVSTLDVAALRKKIDEVSKAYRELDTKIQQKNWSTEVV